MIGRFCLFRALQVLRFLSRTLGIELTLAVVYEAFLFLRRIALAKFRIFRFQFWCRTFRHFLSLKAQCCLSSMCLKGLECLVFLGTQLYCSDFISGSIGSGVASRFLPRLINAGIGRVAS